MAGNWREPGFRTENSRTRTQDWEQQNEDTGPGTLEQRLRTWNNRLKTQDWEQEKKGSGLEQQNKGSGLERT
jgi:hypothetical protein